LVACGLSAMVIVPALAWGAAADPVITATIEAHDDGTGAPGPVSNWFQDASQADKTDSSVTIKAGESVRFRAVTPASGTAQLHNANFADTTKPSTCVMTKQGTVTPPDNDTVEPLPTIIQKGPWEGYCTFPTVGTYTFVCDAHVGMSGTVIVEKAPDPTPTPTATPVETVVPQPTVAPVPTASPTPVPTVAPKPASASLDAPSKPKLATFVKSGLKLSGPCASITSGKVTLAVTKSVAKKLKLKSTTLGTGTGRCGTDGFFSVTVKPSAAVKKALKKHKGSVAATATLTASGVKPATRKLTLK